MNKQNTLQHIGDQIGEIIAKARDMENKYRNLIDRVHPIYRKSALNLVHYLAFRSFDIEKLQNHLRYMGLLSISDVEAHVMSSLMSLQTIVNQLCGLPIADEPAGIISIKKSEKLLQSNTDLLFGYKSTNRWTRIMVTLPSSAAHDYALVNRLVKLGMNSARINCAHEDPAVWTQMIEHIKRSNKASKKSCKIVMDLSGPKFRTGDMKPGPQMLRFKPTRDISGRITKPAKLWIAPPDVFPPNDTADAIIPIDTLLLKKFKRGDTIQFTDARGKKSQIVIDGKQGNGRWGLCYDSAYLKAGTELTLNRVKASGQEMSFVGTLLPLEQFILLCKNDILILHKEPIPGEPAQFNKEGELVEHAHISCTLPELFEDVMPGEKVFFNDGKIEGLITSKEADSISIKITHAKKTGSKLRGGKGINFPDSDLKIKGLTAKDKEDMDFVAQWADVVNLSFVNHPSDVQAYLDEFHKKEKIPGLIVKIETLKGFIQLPEILLCAMQAYPVGIMIARGDLAIETGWKNFAAIQEEIVRMGDAAHIPAVLATQVLESLTKSGVPTRSEITDAALAQRAECIMLNKGEYIEKTMGVLNSILKKLQKNGCRNNVQLPKLKDADGLKLSL